MCIQMAKDAIESETVATDTTIALSMLMASEAVSIPFYFSFLLFIFGKRLTWSSQFLEGDMNAYWSHGAGVMKMVRARGGVDMLGMSGFLTRTVSESIYLTQTNMIAGPNVLDPKIIVSWGTICRIAIGFRNPVQTLDRIIQFSVQVSGTFISQLIERVSPSMRIYGMISMNNYISDRL